MKSFSTLSQVKRVALGLLSASSCVLTVACSTNGGLVILHPSPSNQGIHIQSVPSSPTSVPQSTPASVPPVVIPTVSFAYRTAITDPTTGASDLVVKNSAGNEIQIPGPIIEHQVSKSFIITKETREDRPGNITVRNSRGDVILPATPVERATNMTFMVSDEFFAYVDNDPNRNLVIRDHTGAQVHTAAQVRDFRISNSLIAYREVAPGANAAVGTLHVLRRDFTEIFTQQNVRSYEVSNSLVAMMVDFPLQRATLLTVKDAHNAVVLAPTEVVSYRITDRFIAYLTQEFNPGLIQRVTVLNSDGSPRLAPTEAVLYQITNQYIAFTDVQNNDNLMVLNAAGLVGNFGRVAEFQLSDTAIAYVDLNGNLSAHSLADNREVVHATPTNIYKLSNSVVSYRTNAGQLAVVDIQSGQDLLNGHVPVPVAEESEFYVPFSDFRFYR